jgi:hypothetical protein
MKKSDLSVHMILRQDHTLFYFMIWIFSGKNWAQTKFSGMVRGYNGGQNYDVSYYQNGHNINGTISDNDDWDLESELNTLFPGLIDNSYELLNDMFIYDSETDTYTARDISIFTKTNNNNYYFEWTNPIKKPISEGYQSF